MQFRSILAALAVLALAAAAYSQTPAEQAQRLLDRADKNNDDKLAADELPPNVRRGFERMDKDGDKFVSLKELTEFVQAREQRPRNDRNQPPLGDRVETHFDVPYAGTDNPRQALDILLPKERAEGKTLPVVVFIHGGGWRNGDKHGGRGRLAPLVASGDYAGVSVGYRLSGEAQWPAQIHDCKAAIRWIKANAKKYNWDPERIAVWGASAGGHLVSMLGTSGDVKQLEGDLGNNDDYDSRVKCVVNFFGPTDMLTMGEGESSLDHNSPNSPEAKLLGGAIPDNKEKAKQASPVAHVSKGDASFLTLHGDKDPVVPYHQAERIHAALKKAGVPSILVTVAGAGHGFGGPEVDERVNAFLQRELLAKEVEVSSEPIKQQPRRRN